MLKIENFKSFEFYAENYIEFDLKTFDDNNYFH